jgi:hypothetical protein
MIVDGMTSSKIFIRCLHSQKGGTKLQVISKKITGARSKADIFQVISEGLICQSSASVWDEIKSHQLGK